MAALSRETGLRRTQVLTTIVVERVFDLAALGLIAAADVAARAVRVAAPQPHDRRDRDLRRASRSCSPRSPRRTLRALGARADPSIPVLGGARGERTIALAARRHRLAARHAGARDRDGLVARELDRARALELLRAARCSTRARPGTRRVISLLATNLAMVVPSSAASIGVFEVAAQRVADAVRRAGGARAELRARAARREHHPDPAAGRRRARAGRLVGRELMSGSAGAGATDPRKGRVGCYAMISHRAADQCAPDLRGPARRHGRGVPGGARRGGPRRRRRRLRPEPALAGAVLRRGCSAPRAAGRPTTATSRRCSSWCASTRCAPCCR